MLVVCIVAIALAGLYYTYLWSPKQAQLAILQTRIDSLVQNGVLELSLKNAIALSLENNLDLAIARYNIPIAEADILRTRAGGSCTSSSSWA